MNLNIYIYAFCRHSPKWFTKEEPKHKVHNYCIESTGTYKKKKITKKVNIFCHSFQKVKPIYYMDSLHIEWNISSLYFLNFDDYGLQIMKTQNSVSQKIRILHKINKNRIF